MRIDAHQHFWLMNAREGQWPPPELSAIYRDFLPRDLQPLLKAEDIDGTVLVQTMESTADTAFMLDLANTHEFIRGVVGWVDLKSPDATSEIVRLSQHPKFRGVRPMLQGLTEDEWIDDTALDAAIAALEEHDLVFDALVLPRHLPHLLAFARRYPGLPIVIDHAAKPLISSGHYIDWRKDMERLAALPHVHCKLSGLWTEAGEQKPQAIRPYAETVFELFGPERTIWGSDWPVLRLAGDYGDWFGYCRDIIPAAHHDAVFGGNAIRFYRLAPLSSGSGPYIFMRIN